MLSLRIRHFVVTMLIFCLTATVTAVWETSTTIPSFGTIKYWDFFFEVGFENDDCFKLGINGRDEYLLYGTFYEGVPPYWDRGGYPQYENPGYYRFEADTTIAHSGSQSALLELIDPIDNGKRRNQIHHDWNPLTTEHIWQEVCYYIPTDIMWTHPDTGEPQFYGLGALISERLWDPDLPMDAQEYGIKISVIWHKYRGNPVFNFVQGPVGVDNNDDGVRDFDTPADQYSELGSEGVPTGRWIKIKTHVYRNLDNWDQGYVEFWFTDETTGDTVYHREDPCRTIGIDPQRIADAPPYNVGGYYGYLSSSFTLYAGGLDGGMPPPCKIYVDDFYAGVLYAE